MERTTKVIIAATGPSFSPEQAAYIEAARGADSCRVIAVSDNYALLPSADICYACDGPWWDIHYPKIMNEFVFQGELWTQDRRSAARYGIKYVNSSNGRGLSRVDMHIHTGGNGGYQAVGLAWQPDIFNAGCILLVGFDYQRTGGKAHYFGEHPKGLSRSHPYRSWIERFRQLARDVKDTGVDLINCSIETAIDSVPRARLEDCI